MIKITNNMKEFIEVQTGPLLVYGSGNNGYYAGYYLNKCQIEWDGYIDRKEYPQGTLFNEHPIYLKDSLVTRYRGEKIIRLIITPVEYQGILEELLWLDQKYNVNAICLVPVYEDLTQHKATYNINKCLAYFRNKLFVGDTPTIISNDCTGGMIYNAMDMIMLSPTINTGLNPSDFIKLCKNTEYYLNQEMDVNSLHYIKRNDSNAQDVLLCGRIEDITIIFGHLKPSDKPVERWNMMRGKINRKNIIYIMRDSFTSKNNIPLKIKREFMELKGKKMFYSGKSSAYCDGISGFYISTDFMFDRATPIETYFDVLEWLNERNEF